MIKLVGGSFYLIKTICDGIMRKRGVMLPSGKSLLLRRGDDPAVFDQRRGAVVIECRDTENPHRAV